MERPPEPFLTVLIPAYNEAEGIAQTVVEADRAVKIWRHEIIVIDDGSTDETWNEVVRCSEELAAVNGLRFTRNFGHQAALLAGFEESCGDAVITMDGDGQHPPALLGKFVERWLQGANVVQALREDREEIGFLKRTTSRLFYWFFSRLAGTMLPPGSSDFRLLDRKVVNLVLSNRRSALFLRGFIPWMGVKIETIDYQPLKRRGGNSKYSFGSMFKLAMNGVLRFSVKPLRMATILGLLTCVLSFCYLFFVLAVRLFGSGYVPGWASIAGLLTLLAGVQLIVTGIIGEYLGMVFETQLDRPDFIVSEKVGAQKTAPTEVRSPHS